MAISSEKPRQALALLFSDIVGYSTMVAKDEAQGIELLTEYRLIVRRTIPLYGGREQDTIGDGFFVEFGSVQEAVQCAIEIQTRLRERNLANSKSRQLQARIGIHFGEVIPFEKKLVGDSVNLASRIESFAAPGDVCVTDPVVKQLTKGIAVRSMGKREIKGFSEPLELFHVISPWEKSTGNLLKRSLFVLRRWSTPNNDRSYGAQYLSGLLGTILILFSFLVGKTWEDFDRYTAGTLDSMSSRELASENKSRIPVAFGWKFLVTAAENPAQLAAGSSSGWQSLEGRDGWQLTETLSSGYWLKNEIPAISGGIKYPALVLGLIPGAHRVYLNDIFIGGSNHFFNLAKYAFDARILRSSTPNQILIRVAPKTSLTPGLRPIPAVGSYLGEFNEVYADVVSNEYYYHIFLSVYLATAFFLFLACCLFYLCNRTEKKYLYFSIFLLLGTLELFYYNGLVGSVLDYRLHRVCKLLALSVSSVVLLSTYLHLVKSSFWEQKNNILAMFWSVFVLAIIFTPHLKPETLVVRSNYVLLSTLIYTALWVVGVVLVRLFQLGKDRGRRALLQNSFYYEGIVVLFGVLMGMLAYRSLELNLGLFSPSPLLRHLLLRLGSAYPFIFSGMILLMGLVDYITKNRAATHQDKKDDLNYSILHTLMSSAKHDEAIATIHRKVVDFVNAQRSTLYIIDEGKKGEVLKASYLIHKRVGQHEIQKTVYPADGIIGYVCQSRSPLLIGNIQTDYRFKDYLKEREKKGTYKTKSCMLFPLIARGQLVGILTLADRADQEPFSREDFSLVHLISKDLSFLIDTQKLQHAA